MRREEKIKFVLNNLKKYENKNLPVSNNSLNNLNVEELNKLEEIFLNESLQPSNVKRPFCPSNNPNEISKARKKYRMGIHTYIASHGYELGSPFHIKISVYEAIANFLDSQKFQKYIK